MPEADDRFVWVFCASNARFPGGVFSTPEKAEEWIARTSASGVLTAYPLDQGAYDWAVARGSFTPKKPEHETPRFIERFTSASQPHHHYEDGRRV